jgi:hypothetical protein
VSWVAVIGGVVAAGSAAYQSNQAGKAAGKSAKGYQAGIDEQRRQFDTIMSMLAPQRGLGDQATNALARLYGYAPTASGVGGYGGYDPNAPKPPPGYVDPKGPSGAHGFGRSAMEFSDVLGLDPFGSSSKKKRAKKKAAAAQAQYEAELAAYNQQRQQQFATDQAALPQGLDVFQKSPDYQWKRDEGMRDIGNSFAARGGAFSGNALRALTDFNSNLASGEFGNFVNRQLAMAGLGQTATSQGVSSANYTGGNIANLLGQQGNARASGIVDQSNALTGGVNDLAGLWGSWQRNRQTAQPTGWANRQITAGYG